MKIPATGVDELDKFLSTFDGFVNENMILVSIGFFTAALLVHFGFIKMIKSLIWKIIIQTAVLGAMAVFVALCYRHITTKLFSFLGVKTLVEIAGSATSPGDSPLYSPSGLELVTDLAIVFFATIIGITYLYGALPFSLIPNWLPILGKMDDFFVTGVSVLSLLCIALTCNLQYRYTEQGHTHNAIFYMELAHQYLYEFWGLEYHQKVNVVEIWVADAFKFIVDRFHL